VPSSTLGGPTNSQSPVILIGLFLFLTDSSKRLLSTTKNIADIRLVGFFQPGHYLLHLQRISEKGNVLMTALLNRDINARFEDWLISPTETLDFEVKNWLDLTDVEARGTVAKALIALENHGGGFLLIGFSEDKGRLIPNQQRPASLAQYGTDVINAIINKYA